MKNPAKIIRNLACIIPVLFMAANLNAAQVAFDYAYDDLNRLTSATYQGGNGMAELTWQYDPLGNITEHTIESALDSDGDGLSDSLENRIGTDPEDMDSDDDGISDGDEYFVHDTDPSAIDSDSDGIQDGTELGLTAGTPDTDPAVFQPDADNTTTTDPLYSDTDNDGWLDGQEDENGNGSVDGGEKDPIVDDPFIVGIAPALLEAGVQITIDGNTFGWETQIDSDIVFSGGVSATTIISWSDNRIVCIVPDGIQPGCVTVHTDNGVTNCIAYDMPASISGTIYEGDGVTVLPGSSVQLYSGDPCGEYSFLAGVYCGDGTYTLSGIPTGTYFLRAFGPENYLSEWWSGPDSSPECVGAQAIILSSAGEQSNVDFQLDYGSRGDGHGV